MFAIEWIDLVILVLASYRLTRLIVFDEITSFIRSPFLMVSYQENDAGQLIESIEFKGKGFRNWVGRLLSCHWCVGIWTSFGIVLLYMYFPAFYPLLLILAVAGAAAFIQSKSEY
ncbi:DUF1360 domain-containing protein [Halalkalibacter okhensis]|uniref:Sporulation protein n=1 Tax=Halalkalibacter okhensis TaxID=333138 RepID=A0A0B0IJQ8_9BACI|nr:DUF1360 domain-containing protein [Halalkalibacter okhensis]KHF39851.1 sporulation protein [Halalkalibacter okhensis]